MGKGKLNGVMEVVMKENSRTMRWMVQGSTIMESMEHFIMGNSNKGKCMGMVNFIGMMGKYIRDNINSVKSTDMVR